MTPPSGMGSEEQIAQAARAAAPVFAAMGWTWREEPQPPTEEEIADTFRQLHRDVKREHGQYISTGRLRVTWDKDFGVEFFVEVA